MGTYQWMSAHLWDQVPGGSVSDPAWWTIAGAGNTILSCPSPVGAGDVLVRSEVAAWIGLQAYDSYGDGAFFLWSVTTHLLGEVTTTGHGVDPAHVGAGGFAFSTEMHWTGHSEPFASPADSFQRFANASTGGYITSKARRGPEHYGSGAPAFNLTCYTDGSLNWVPGHSDVATAYGFTVRTLWLVP